MTEMACNLLANSRLEDDRHKSDSRFDYFVKMVLPEKYETVL